MSLRRVIAGEHRTERSCEKRERNDSSNHKKNAEDPFVSWNSVNISIANSGNSGNWKIESAYIEVEVRKAFILLDNYPVDFSFDFAHEDEETAESVDKWKEKDSEIDHSDGWVRHLESGLDSLLQERLHFEELDQSHEGDHIQPLHLLLSLDIGKGYCRKKVNHEPSSHICLSYFPVRSHLFHFLVYVAEPEVQEQIQ